MPGVHLGVQGLHPPVEALGEAGEVLDLGDRDPGVGDPGGGRAGGHQRDPGVVQAAGELLQTGLVVDGDQGPRGPGGARRGRQSMAVMDTPHLPMRAPRRSMRSTSLPGGGPPAPVVCPQANSEAPEPHLAAGDGEALAGHPADRRRPACARSATLIRSCSVSTSSSSSTRTATWSTIGPVSTPVVHDEQRRAGDLDAVRERVGSAVHARERRQQRGVGVDVAAGVLGQERLPGQLHEAGRDHQVGRGARGTTR